MPKLKLYGVTLIVDLTVHALDEKQAGRYAPDAPQET